MHLNHHRSNKNGGKVLRPFCRSDYKALRSHITASLAIGKVLIGFGTAWKSARVQLRSMMLDLLTTEEGYD